MLGQHLARPQNHLVRQSRQLGDLDPVTAVRRAGFHFAQKNDPAAGLFHRDVKFFTPESRSASSVSSK